MIPKKWHSHIKTVKKSLLRPQLILPAILGSILLVMVAALITISLFEKKYEGTMYPNVTVNGQDVAGKTEEEVIELFAEENRNYEQVMVEVQYKEQPIATFSGKELEMKTNIKDIAKQAYLIGRSDHKPTKIKQQAELLLGLHTYELTSGLQYIEKPINEFVQVAKDTYYKEPKDAKFLFENGKVSSFTEHENGLEVDAEQFEKDISRVFEEIKKSPENKVIVLKDRVLQPEITLSQTNDLGIEELIGVGVSDYSGSSEDRIYNLKLAAATFNGVIIPPNEEFSFNKIIGDISSSTGYRPSYIIKNGQTVLGDGGGVCQVSTTAFRAALNTGLPIVERHAHAYRVSYYENDAEPGLDATIYTPSVDFRFKNDTPSNILIQTEIIDEENILRFKLYGKKDNRVVELTNPEVWDVAPPPEPRNQDDPNLPKGTVKQVDYAAWGAKSRFTYKVMKDGKVLHEEEFYSSYRPWQAVFLVGQG